MIFKVVIILDAAVDRVATKREASDYNIGDFVFF